MRVRVIRAHPLQDSFNAAIHARAVAGLARAGHDWVERRMAGF